jgi:hypothetical protein
MKYFSLSRYGFYDDTMLKIIPEDAIALSDEQYQYLLEKPVGKKYGVINGTVCFVDKVITAEQVRSRRDALIAETRWRVERHADEVAMGVTPSENVGPVLQYIQSLRDITKQPGFPASVIWPMTP